VVVQCLDFQPGILPNAAVPASGDFLCHPCPEFMAVARVAPFHGLGATGACALILLVLGRAATDLPDSDYRGDKRKSREGDGFSDAGRRSSSSPQGVPLRSGPG